MVYFMARPRVYTCMAASDYQLITHWYLQAPLQPVWDALMQPESWRPRGAVRSGHHAPDTLHRAP